MAIVRFSVCVMLNAEGTSTRVQEPGLGRRVGPGLGAAPGCLGCGGSAPTCSSSRWICSVSSWMPGCGAFSSRPGGAENTSSFRGPLCSFHLSL